ncbi:MAG: hypothetical protein LUE96_03065 [Lachnospiraceae bacterium]|nr:hypothetical protein [Lachnospiraceae bacterium]
MRGIGTGRRITRVFAAAVFAFTALCGCSGMQNAGDMPLPDLIGRVMSEPEAQSEPQTQESEEEQREIDEIYYSYYALTQEEQKLYLEMLDTLTDMSGEVRLSTMDVTVLDRIFACVLNDHPELFYVEGFKYTEHLIGDELSGITFEGNYSMTKEEAQQTLAEIESSLSGCMSAVLPGGDEYGTVKYLYEYLINNTEYDKDAENNQNICSVFLTGRSVCQGYAKAMQYMLQKVGIQAVLVTGYTGAERHAWNLVRVNGSYYYLDPTWGDASYSYSGDEASGSGTFFPAINYDYFLVTTDEISKTHSFEDTVALPACESLEDSYYVREGLYFESYDRERLAAVFDSDAVKMTDYVTLKCADAQIYGQMLSALIDDRQIFEFIVSGEGTISYASNDELCTISFWNIFS